MQQPDKLEFVKTLTGLAAVKPGSKLTPEAIEIYWLSLADWTLEEFKQAAAHLAKSVEFMPNPFHFEQLRMAANDCSPDAAWEQLLHNHGECSDSVGARALRSLGGWRVVGYADLDRLPWLKERFREAYENFADSKQAAESAPSLTHDGPRRIGQIMRGPDA